MTITKR